MENFFYTLFVEFEQLLSLNLGAAKHFVATFLQEHDSDAPQLVSKCLFMHVLGLDAVQLVLANQERIAPKDLEKIWELTLRHAKGEPLAYLVGYKEFYGRNFLVNKHTLIPRPESEDVLEKALELSRSFTEKILFADVGTGSGCLAVSFVSHIENCAGFMLDICPNALDVAIQNAQLLKVAHKIMPVHADLCALPFAKNSLHMLISNPPYVSTEELTSLQKNVRDFEPISALVPTLPSHLPSDTYGLGHLEALARQAFDILKNGGVCIVEHGFKQAKQVRELFQAHGAWKSVTTGQDLAGLDRYLLAVR